MKERVCFVHRVWHALACQSFLPFNVDVAHFLSCDAFLIQDNVLGVPDDHTQVVSERSTF